MTQLNILVEGQTEENFVRDVLAEHLANFGVVVTQRRFITGKTRPASKTGKRQNILHKGGITSYQQVVNDLNRWRNENRRATLTTMIDFYGLPDDFPKSALSSDSALEKVKTLETRLISDSGLDNFIPYIQMHEFEALLFSDVEILDALVSTDALPNPQTLRSLLEIRAQSETPEHINDSPQTAPSKRLDQVYRGRYIKTDGSIVAKRIGLVAIRRECRHFDAWLTKLENLNSQGAS